MDTSIIIAIISGVCSAGIVGFIQFLIQRKDTRNDDIKSIKDKLTALETKVSSNALKSEKDIIRTQMLLLMADYPMDEAELMKLAEHYFNDLHGDWYMTSLFNKHLVNNNIVKPEWLRSED